MASKSMKPSVPARPQELTPEQKAEQVARFLSQKRESFALTAFAGICRTGQMHHQPTEVAAWAVDVADALMEKLYPMPKEDESHE